MLIGIGLGVAVAAAMIFLVFVVGRYSTSGDRSASWLAAGLSVAAMVALGVANLASVNYTMPVGWIAALIGAAAAVVGLFWMTGRRVGWKRPAVLILVGLLLASVALFVVLAIAGLGGSAIQPLLRARAQQIATAQGFTALLPPDKEMDTTSGRPVDPLGPGPGGPPRTGLWMAYESFRLEERKAEGALDEAALRGLVTSGAEPVDGVTIPADASVSLLEVKGAPAIGVRLETSPIGAGFEKSGVPDVPVTVLITTMGGTEVRLSSWGGEAWDSERGATRFDALSLDELVAIAESLEPVR